MSRARHRVVIRHNELNRVRPYACDRPRLDDRPVAPEGSPTAPLYLVGEASGRQEAETSRPFVSPVGAALRDMMREAGIDMSRVRLASAIPFRPIERSRIGRVRNRRPTEKELRTYGQAVLSDIAKVQPRVISALGKSAAMLFGASTPVQRSRKRIFRFRNTPVHITYHPEFVPRFGGRGSVLSRSVVGDLRILWNDARRSLSTPTSRKPSTNRHAAGATAAAAVLKKQSPLGPDFSLIAESQHAIDVTFLSFFRTCRECTRA